MPRPKKNESAALAIPQYAESAIAKTHLDNPRIMADGECHPQWTWRNLTDYGYLCPRREYIESQGSLSFKELADKWNVGAGDISRWAGERRWAEARVKEWDSAAITNWKAEAEALMAIQKKETQGQYEQWRKLRQMTTELLAKGTVPEQTATGIIYDRELTFKEIGEATKILATCDEQIARTIGMGKDRIRRQFSEDKEENGEVVVQRVRRIRHNYTIEETVDTPMAEIRSLPEPSEVVDYIEAEVTE